MKIAIRVLAASGLILAACDASTPLPIGAGGAAPSGPSTVDGTWIDLYVTEGKEETVPRDLSSATVIAYVTVPGGGFVVAEGRGKSDGTFAIPNVPDAPFYLTITGEGLGFFDTYYTKERHIDLGSAIGGRRDQTQILSSGNILLSSSGGAPWADGDTLNLFSFDSNGESGPLTNAVIGATDLPATNLQWGGGLPNANDRVYATQHAQRIEADGTIVTNLVSFGDVPSFTLQNGGAAVVSVAMSPVATTEATSLHVRTSKLAEIALANPLNELVENVGVFIYAGPNAEDLGALEVGAGELLSASAASDSADVMLDTQYANPFPTSFGKVLFVDVNAVFHPGAENVPIPFFFTIPFSEVTSDPIDPPLGTPDGFKIDGRDATSPATASAEFPVLSWDAPKLGHPTVYRVEIWHIPSKQTNALEYGGSMSTSERTLPLLPGTVMPGETYVFEVIATTGSALTAKSPHARSGRAASSGAVTNRVTFTK